VRATSSAISALQREIQEVILYL